MVMHLDVFDSANGVLLRTIGAIVFLSVAWGVPAASAQSSMERRADRAMERWEGENLEDAARSLRERFGIVPRRASGWGESELVAIQHGIASLPRAFRTRVETPIFLERRERVCSFGMGDGSAGCPRFSDDGRTFYIYDIGDLSNRLRRRLAPGLNAEERRRLLYRRAGVHLVVAKLDQLMNWSEERGWKTINGWKQGEPLNQDWWGYSRPLGRRSAHLDLVTFAEEFFARPEALLREQGASQRLEAFNPNDSVVCKMMTRSRYLRERTAEIAPGWTPPKRANESALDGTWNAAGTGCPSFEEWADFSHVRGLQFVYASASSENPESLFGHLLIRISYGPGADIFRQGFEPTYQFGAVTGSRISTVGYFFQGLFGGFPSVLEFNTSRASERIYLRYERRNLRKFRLQLTRDQRLHTMQRIWEAERHIRYPYYFFQHNCASFIVDLMRPVLSEELEGLPSIAVMPTDVLDAFALTDNDAVEGQAYMDQRYRRFLSSEARAVRAVRERRRVLREVRSADSGDGEGMNLDRVHEAVESMDAERRHRAYASVRKHIQNGVEPGAARRFVDYLYYSSVIERYFVERARFARLERLADRAKSDVEFTIQDRLQLRRSVYRIEDLKERLQAWRERMRARVKPITAAMESDAELPKRSEQLRDTYLGSLNTLSTAIEQTEGDWDGAAYERRKEDRARATHYTRQKDAIGPSGSWRGATGVFGAGGRLPAGSGGREYRAGFELDLAFLRDEFGEFRVRGFRPEVESRSFDLELQTWLGAQWQRRIRAEMILYRFFSLNQKPGPMRDDWRDAVGWGIEGGVRHDGARGLDFGGWVSGGLIFPLFQSELGTDYLAFSVMADGRGDLARGGGALMFGGRSFLRGQVHLYGNYGNLGRLKIQTRQYSTVRGRWEHESMARLSTRHTLGDVSRRPLWLVPYVEGHYSSISYAGDADLFDVRGGLRFEYPL